MQGTQGESQKNREKLGTNRLQTAEFSLKNSRLISPGDSAILSHCIGVEDVAQSAEHLFVAQEVAGSIPVVLPIP